MTPVLSERRILREIHRLLGSRPDVRLWRQSVGLAVSAAGHPIRFGLPGMADLSGILPDGRRLEIEVKSARGTLSAAQRAFGAMIERFGGVFLVAHSARDALDQLQRLGYCADDPATSQPPDTIPFPVEPECKTQHPSRPTSPTASPKPPPRTPAAGC